LVRKEMKKRRKELIFTCVPANAGNGSSRTREA